MAIEHADPIDLNRLTVAFGALSEEYEKHVKRVLPEVEPEATRLLITEVRKGSTIIEMIPQLAWLAPFVPDYEKVMATAGFVRNVRDLLSPYFTRGNRNSQLSTGTVRNLLDLAAIIASDTSGSLSFAARTEKADGTVEQFKFEKRDAQVAVENLNQERVERERRATAQHEKVLLVFRQTRAVDAELGKPTGDMGIIEFIDPRPRRVIYVSQLAGDRIKSEIQAPGQNPYELGFIVDVNVETAGGRPVAYRVMHLHEVIQLSGEP